MSNISNALAQIRFKALIFCAQNSSGPRQKALVANALKNISSQTATFKGDFWKGKLSEDATKKSIQILTNNWMQMGGFAKGSQLVGPLSSFRHIPLERESLSAMVVDELRTARDLASDKDILKIIDNSFSNFFETARVEADKVDEMVKAKRASLAAAVTVSNAPNVPRHSGLTIETVGHLHYKERSNSCP